MSAISCDIVVTSTLSERYGKSLGIYVVRQEAQLHDEKVNIIERIQFNNFLKENEWPQLTLGDIKAKSKLNTDKLQCANDYVHGWLWGYLPTKVTTLESTFMSHPNLKWFIKDDGSHGYSTD